jgi:ABC-2 type transport system permease protein
MCMPIARSSVVVSRFVFQALMGAAQVVTVLLVAFAMGVRIATGPAGVLLILAAAALLTMAVTAAFSALAYRVPGHGTFFAITGFITLPVLFMSSAFVPLAAMPRWMAVVAHVNPLTYAIGAMRTLIVDGWRADIASDLALLAGFALICLAAGTYQFRRQTGERVEE